jgi:protein-L-isoaspartate O-methyltransferase
MAPSAAARAGYTYKSSPYSSHALLVDALPTEGLGRRVLDIGCAAGYLAEILAGRGYQVVGIERAGAHGDTFPDNVTLVEADLDDGVFERALSRWQSATPEDVPCWSMPTCLATTRPGR